MKIKKLNGLKLPISTCSPTLHCFYSPTPQTVELKAKALSSYYTGQNIGLKLPTCA